VNRLFWNNWWQGIRNSYAQLFFALNPWVGWGAIVASFSEPRLGIWGLASVLIANTLATLAGQDRTAVKEGMFGFNALLLGLTLAYRYNPNPTFVVVWASALVLLVLLTVWMGKRLAQSQLPALTLPFVGAIWVVVLAAGRLPGLEIAHHFGDGTTTHSLFGLSYPLAWEGWGFNALTPYWSGYFRVLSATFFQPHVSTGVLLFVVMLIHSRIQTMLTLIGYAMAYYSFELLGADTHSLVYQLAGPNFLFLAIAVGGFYLIPSTASLLTVVALTPVLALVHLALMPVLLRFGLAPYTLSFNVLTILWLYFLRQRLVWQPQLEIATIQYYSPEKALYKHLAGLRWRVQSRYARFRLPVWGIWKISQGYDGRHTHLKEWGKALDFVVGDEQGNHFKGKGTRPDDFYCYNKPVLAPLDGYVHRIDNHVYDNEEIGDVDTGQNWGNCIVLNHNNGLYSLLAHLRKDSMQVVVGQWVTKGTLLANCGNSGRSPEPHLHFQIQTTPEVGAKTYAYPIAYFMEYRDGREHLRSFSVPEEGQRVGPVETDVRLSDSLKFKPGMRLHWKSINSYNKIHSAEWHVATDVFNQTYLHCARTGDRMWFNHDEVLFQAFDYEGTRTSLLYQFYLASYRLFLGEHRGIRLSEPLPLIDYGNRFLRALQDIFAPFFRFYQAQYTSAPGRVKSDETQDSEVRVLESAVALQFLGRRGPDIGNRFLFGSDGLIVWELQKPGRPAASYSCHISG
jgi:urea transporter/murein DD-endopeptidase MepM/ murein hydrolase activator NlpD